MLQKYSDSKKYPHCGFCKHAKNRKEWEDKIQYGDRGYDKVYCEEITCDITNIKHNPFELGCEGKYYEKE